METREQIAVRVAREMEGQNYPWSEPYAYQKEFARRLFAEQEKQEPVHWRCVLSAGQEYGDYTPVPKIAGFSDLKAAEQFIAEKKDFGGWIYTLEPLYAAPIPTPEEVRDAERYRKLRRWMTSNVKEGWTEVENLASVGCYASYEDFDGYLDRLPVCNVGLSYRKEDDTPMTAAPGEKK